MQSDRPHTDIPLSFTDQPWPECYESLLLTLLQNACEETFIAKGDLYPIKDKQGTLIQDVSFSHAVIIRQREAVKDAYTIEVISNEQFAKGGTRNSINEILFTIRQCNDNPGKLTLKDSERLIKRQIASLYALESRTKHEYQLSPLHLHVKKPIYREIEKTAKHESFLILRKMPGIVLSHYLHDDHEDKSQPMLTMDYLTRLLSTKACLLAFIEQIFHTNVIHRDIKPDNFLLDHQHGFAVNFIDYELSVIAPDQLPRFRRLTEGGKLYFAYERVEGKASSRMTDWVALVLCLCEFWGVTYENLYTTELPKLFKSNALRFAMARQNQIFKTLFKDIHDIPEEMNAALKNWFEHLVTIGTDNMWQPSKALEELNIILFNSFEASYATDKVSAIFGYDASEHINELIHESMVSDKSKQNNLASLATQIESMINLLRKAPNHVIAMEVFFKNIRLALPRLATIDAISDHFKQLFHEREQLLAKLPDYRKRLENDANLNSNDDDIIGRIKLQKSALRRIEHKLATYNSNLVHFAAVNHSIKQRFQELDNLDKKLNQHANPNHSMNCTAAFFQPHELATESEMLVSDCTQKRKIADIT